MLITKEDMEVKLSDLNIQVKDVEESSSGLEIDARVVKGRSGKVHSGSRFTEKLIRVTGDFYVSDLLSYEEKKDYMNGLLIDSEPYFITKLIPETSELYDFEMPGQSSEDINLMDIPHEPYHYRYKVMNRYGLEPVFQGKSSKGLLFRYTLEFETAEMPFGETVPIDVMVAGNYITYRGTAKNSQLEYPWEVVLTATETQSGSFSVTIGNRTFEHNSQTEIQPGDVFVLKGVETLKNGNNVNNYTNYEHFELKPSLDNRVPFDTTFIGDVEVMNFVEFYK